MGLALTPDVTLLLWVLSNHQEPEVPPCLHLAGRGPIFSARICAVVFSTCSACSVFPSGASVCLILLLLWRSSFFGLLRLLSPAYCLGISGDMALNFVFFQSFQGASWAWRAPCLLLSALDSPFPLSSSLLPSITSVPAESHCVCVSIPPTSPGPCSGPVILSLSSVSPPVPWPSLLGNTPEVLEFGALPVPKLSGGPGSH